MSSCAKCLLHRKVRLAFLNSWEEEGLQVFHPAILSEQVFLPEIVGRLALVREEGQTKLCAHSFIAELSGMQMYTMDYF